MYSMHFKTWIFCFFILVLFGDALNIPGKIICFEFRCNWQEQPRNYRFRLSVSISEDNKIEDGHPGERQSLQKRERRICRRNPNGKRQSKRLSLVAVTEII